MKRIISIILLVAVIVLVGTVSATTVTFYPSEDGYTQHGQVDNVWNIIRNGGGTGYGVEGITSVVDTVAWTNTDKWVRISRGALIFDTSSIPDDATIDSASLGIWTSGTTQSPDVGIGITNFNIDGAISSDDYNNYDNTRYATDKNLSTMTGTSSYNVWSFNSDGKSGISKTGSTGLGIRTQFDIDNYSTWSNSANSAFTFRTSEYGVNNRPYLTVSYTQPPTTDFSASTTSGYSPLTVSFTDTSTNTPTNWKWCWYDNETISSTSQNPTTTFTIGTYNIRHYSANTGGLDWENKTAYITAARSPMDIRISSVSSVTNKGATFSIEDGLSGNHWIEYGQTPGGHLWKSHNATSTDGTSTIILSGGTVRTNTLYYAHACQTGGCNSSYSTFTTGSTGEITQTNYGAGFNNLTESDFNTFNLFPMWRWRIPTPSR
jgi:PKD repeat protein